MKKINEIIKNKYKWIVMAILLIGIILRFIAIDKIPIGINVDEAGMAYDAYCIANYGTDRYANPYPIYMINYGGGQSALYTYLVAILIKIFGFSLFIVRMPAFLFSILYMIIAYLLVKQFKSEKFSIFILFLIVTCPWHFMQSRWGLDCNLMSTLMLLSIYLLLKAKSNWGNILAGISFGITLYSYAISYLIIPVFLVFSLIYLLYIRKIKFSNIIVLGIPLFIFSIPLILNIFVNKGIIQPIRLNFLSIVRLWHYRGDEISIQNILPNLTLIKTIFSYDYNDYNAFPIFGTLYYISIPFALLGFIITIKNSICSIKQKKISLDMIMLLNFISIYSCLLLLRGQSISQSNSIYISLIYFIAIGIKRTVKDTKYFICGILLIYLLQFSLFQCYYFGIYGKENLNCSFNDDVIEITKYLEKYENKQLYLRTYAIQPYIYTLLENKVPPKEFRKNIKMKGAAIIQYNKYLFLEPEEISQDIVYVIKTPECDKEELYEKLRNENFKEEIYKGYIIFYK